MTAGGEDPSARFETQVHSPEMRYAYQLAYSIRMLGGITARYRDAQDDDDLVCAMAMLDAFYVHLRLVAEFLTRQTSNRDFGPANLGVDDWTTPETDAADRLAEYWDRASKYVVHFGHSRVPASLDDLTTFEVSAAALRDMAVDAFEILEQFVMRVETLMSDGPTLTVETLRGQMLRDELDRARAELSQS